MYLKELKTYDFMQFVYFFKTDDFMPKFTWWRSKVYKES